MYSLMLQAHQRVYMTFVCYAGLKFPVDFFFKDIIKYTINTTLRNQPSEIRGTYYILKHQQLKCG